MTTRSAKMGIVVRSTAGKMREKELREIEEDGIT